MNLHKTLSRCPKCGFEPMIKINGKYKCEMCSYAERKIIMEAHKSCPCYLKKKKRYQINKELWFLCNDCNQLRTKKKKKHENNKPTKISA